MCPVDPERAKRWSPNVPVAPPDRPRAAIRSRSGLSAAPAGMSATRKGLSSEPSGLLPGQPALRADGTSRLPHPRGAMPDLGTEELRAAALEAYDDALYAPSSRATIKARRKAIISLLAPWGLEPHPISVENVTKLAASLRAGRYRGAASTLSQYRVDAERGGHQCLGAISRAFTDANRACRRGLGPALVSLPLPFEQLSELPPSLLHGSRPGPSAHGTPW